MLCKISRSLSVLLILLLLSACATMPFFPTPSRAKNRIDQGIYRAPIGRATTFGTFSIKVPQYGRQSEYDTMQVEQKISANGTYVSFGPCANDKTIYRVSIGVPTQITQQAYQQRAYADYVQVLQKSYHQPVQQLLKKQVLLNGRPALYVVVAQTIPITAKVNPPTNNIITYFHGIYFTLYGQYPIMLDVQAGRESAKGQQHLKHAFLQRNWPPMMSFVKSLRINHE